MLVQEHVHCAVLGGHAWFHVSNILCGTRMHQNVDYQGIFEYFVAASEFCLKKNTHTTTIQKQKQKQIKTSSSSFVYLKK